MRRFLETLDRGVSGILVVAIYAYRVCVGPLFRGSCRYQPSCSRYAEEAIRKYGALKGGWLGVKRVGRCHPFRPGGYDPVR